MTRLDDAYDQRVKRIRERLEQFVTTTWLGLGTWRDGDVDRFVEAVLPIVAAGQRQVAQLTDAYLTRVISAQTGRDIPPLALTDDDTSGRTLRNGAEPEEVYRRPFHTTWTALSQGQPLSTALDAGTKRLTDLAMSDVQLAKRQASRARMSTVDEVRWYRRRLTGLENCGMCVVAATQRYWKEDLLPIHPGCDCGVSPETSDYDPGQVIDEDLLDRAHEAIEQRFGRSDAGGRAPDYRKLLLVEEHGELGPVLTVKSHSFTDTGDVRRAADRAIPKYTPPSERS